MIMSELFKFFTVHFTWLGNVRLSLGSYILHNTFQDMLKLIPYFTWFLSLSGRKLIFSNDTGVNLDGHVMLNSGEVRHNWLDVSL